MEQYPLLTTTLLLVFGLVPLLAGFYRLGRAEKTRTWPAVEGVIVSSEVEYRSGDDNGYDHYVYATFEYAVDGKTHKVREIVFPKRSTGTNREAANAALGTFGRGRAVTVHFNPRKPADGTICPGHSFGGWGFVIFGLGALAFLGYIMIQSAMDGHQLPAPDQLWPELQSEIQRAYLAVTN